VAELELEAAGLGVGAANDGNGIGAETAKGKPGVAKELPNEFEPNEPKDEAPANTGSTRGSRPQWKH
jgi:hypothetical protein